MWGQSKVQHLPGHSHCMRRHCHTRTHADLPCSLLQNDSSDDDESSRASVSESGGDLEERKHSHAKASSSGKPHSKPSVKNAITERAVVQPLEKLSPVIPTKFQQKPMVELSAGSNIWYQAYLVKESANEAKLRFPGEFASTAQTPLRHHVHCSRGWLLHVVMALLAAANMSSLPVRLCCAHWPPRPGVNGCNKDKVEWVRKASSRIWRGSLSSSAWRHLGKGAWAPRKEPKEGRSRRVGAPLGRKAKRQHWSKRGRTSGTSF